MNANVDLVIQDLAQQIANLSREKAIYYALAIQKEKENGELKKELEQYKQEPQES